MVENGEIWKNRHRRFVLVGDNASQAPVYVDDPHEVARLLLEAAKTQDNLPYCYRIGEEMCRMRVSYVR
jgi:hypothetical protein